MNILAGRLQPNGGTVSLNGQSLYEQIEELKNYVAYIPQDDAFDEHLTIAENLSFAAAIRAPHLSARDRLRRIDAKLIELGLAERRDSLVGSSSKKFLSGGERKRLNIGLDMIGSADVYLFDEPTSGLSSKDSEHVIEIIRGMAHNKIVLVTDDDIRALVPDELVVAHRQRGLTPDRPVLRGTAQNPDVFFQAREAANPFYAALPAITQTAMDDFAASMGLTILELPTGQGLLIKPPN